MIELLGYKYHIPVINIVRNEKQKNSLLNLGARYVLDSSIISFPDDLYSISHKLNASLVLDAVGGSLTRQLIVAVPSGCSIVLYGNLSGEQPELDYRSMITDNKNISGFFLGNWLKENGTIRSVKNILRVRKLLKKEISIPVQDSFPLNKSQLALETYIENMTAGKVLLKPEWNMNE